MNTHLFLASLHVAAQAMVAAALGSVPFLLKTRLPEPVALASVGVALAQLALLGAWLVWGRSNAALRVAALLAASLAWYFVLTNPVRAEGERPTALAGQLLLYATFVAGLLGAARRCGLKMISVGETAPALSKRSRWQFTLGGLLTTTAIVAMCLAIGQWLEWRILPGPWHDFWSPFTFCLVAALIAAAVVAIVLKIPPDWLVIIGPLALMAVLGFFTSAKLREWNVGAVFYPELSGYSAWYQFVSSEMLVVVGAMIATQVVIVALASAVLQVSGYRLAGSFYSTPK